MAANQPEGYADDFLEQILAIPSYSGLPVADVGTPSETTSFTSASAVSHLSSAAAGGLQQPLFPLGLSLDNGRDDVGDAGAYAVKQERDGINIGNLYAGLEHLQSHAVRQSMPSVHHVQPFQGPPTTSTTVTVPHPPSVRPRVRARRGQATDPHSIAERLRRERISERIKALQELVPSCNKTDRAAMLDEILDYVKFLRLQVKVLSMSRLGGASAVAQLVADIPLQSVESFFICFEIFWIFLYLRGTVVKVDPTSIYGISGPMPTQNERLLSSWRKMLVQPCNTFSLNHSASCPYHLLHSSILPSNQMTNHWSSLNRQPHHRPPIRCTCL